MISSSLGFDVNHLVRIYNMKRLYYNEQFIFFQFLLTSACIAWGRVKELHFVFIKLTPLLLLTPQALEAQEQEKERLRPPQQNPSPVPGNQRSGSPWSDRTPTPEPQGSPSPAASTPDLTTTNTTSSTPPPSAPDVDQDQPPDTASVNGEPENGNNLMNGGEEQATPSRGVCVSTLAFSIGSNSGEACKSFF